MTDVAGILACYRSGQISEADMVEICATWPEVREALEETSITTRRTATVEAKRVHIGYCDDCNGPIIPMTRVELIRDWLAYEIFMALPDRITTTRFGFWLLPWVGFHAYTCTCPGKVLDQHINREAPMQSP